MARTPFGKARPVDKPYAVYKGYGPFGDTEVRVLKTYQHPEKELTNPYARWMIAVKSAHTYGSYDMGDSYILEAIRGLRLVEATPEWMEYYSKPENTIQIIE